MITYFGEIESEIAAANSGDQTAGLFTDKRESLPFRAVQTLFPNVQGLE